MLSSASLHIHIGLHKTGSTSIQAFLNRNARQLRELGILYPSVGQVSGPGHLNLYREAALNPRFSPDHGTWQDVMDLVHGSGSRKVVVSSEGLSMLDVFALEGLVASVSTAHVWVIVYLRPQDQLIQSVYAQRCRDGRVTEPFSTFLEHDGDHDRYRYADLIQPWIDRFGGERMVVRVLESEQLERGSLYADFLLAIGEDPGLTDRLQPVVPMNRSPSPAGLEVLRRLTLSRVRGGTLDRQLFASTVGRSIAKAAADVDDRRSPLMSGRAAVRFRQRFEEQNSRVARNLLGRKDGILFRSEPDESDPGSPEPPLLDVDYLISLLDRVTAYASEVSDVRGTRRHADEMQPGRQPGA